MKRVLRLALVALAALGPMRAAAENGVRAEAIRVAEAVHAAGIERRDPRLRSLIVAHGDGEILIERYFNGADGDAPQRVHSITKSVVSLLIGQALAEGAFPTLDTPLAELYPETLGEPRPAPLRVGHLLTMTTGQRWSERGGGLWAWAMSRDRRGVALGLAMIEPPGEQFRYSTAAADLAGAILADAAGEPLDQIAWRKLFQPLGVDDFHWARLGGDHVNAGSGLWLAPRDLLKLGLLVLNRGRWQGEQLVPEAWIEASTRRHVAASDGVGYGYFWWVRPLAGCETAWAWGRGGQFIIVAPEKDLAIVATSEPRIDDTDSASTASLFEAILAAADGACAPPAPITPPSTRDAQAETLAALPAELRPLFDGFVASVNAGDLDAAMRHYSERFRIGEADKSSRRAFWSRLPRQAGAFGYRLDTVERVAPDLWRFDGLVMGSFGRFGTSFHNILVDGAWRFLGERWAGAPPPTIPQELRTFLDRFKRLANAKDFAAMAALVSDGYRAGGYDKAGLIDRWSDSFARFEGVHFEVKAVEPSIEGYALHGFLAIDGLGRAPLEYLYGHVAREADGLRWIGDGSDGFAIPQP